jgi:hypothetical protein
MVGWLGGGIQLGGHSLWIWTVRKVVNAREYYVPGRRPFKLFPARWWTPSRWRPWPYSRGRGRITTISVIVRRGSPIISIVVSRRGRGIATRICSWVLRAVVARARLITGRWRWRPAHSVIIYITPANRGWGIFAIVSRRRHRPPRWRIIVWATSITGRGWITSRRVLFTIRRILAALGRRCCIVTRGMNSIDQRTVGRRAVASRSAR